MRNEGGEGSETVNVVEADESMVYILYTASTTSCRFQGEKGVRGDASERSDGCKMSSAKNAPYPESPPLV